MIRRGCFTGEKEEEEEPVGAAETPDSNGAVVEWLGLWNGI